MSPSPVYEPIMQTTLKYDYDETGPSHEALTEALKPFGIKVTLEPQEHGVILITLSNEVSEEPLTPPSP